MGRGKTFIVSGPSGVGKSTILHKLFERRKNLYFSVSATTRPPREGEADGKDYHFISVERFRSLIREDAFLEYAEFVGNFYGTPKRFVEEAMDRGEDVILDIELQGANQVHQKMPEAVRIFILPPSIRELERRLVSRGTETAEKIQGRLIRAQVEFDSAHTYDYIVINDDIGHAVDELDAIMTAEHCRAEERAAEFRLQ
ncbi:MAG: guanylate kinase [Oscillospiraceae bacterium]